MPGRPQSPSASREALRVGVLVGPTAVGKSAVAQWIAERLGRPILSADSMLVYRGMDIGTAKPTPAERGGVPYFGIDCVAAGAPFSTGAWLSCVRRQLDEWKEGGEKGDAPADGGPDLVVAGGTGLYVRALLSGLDAPAADPRARAEWSELYRVAGLGALQRALQAHPGAQALLAQEDFRNPRRIIRALERDAAGEKPPASPRVLPERPVAGLLLPRERLAARIMVRIDRMFQDGLVEEAVALRAAGGLSPTAAGAIGYAEALAVADGHLSRQEARERIAARTRQLAKRQMTWFRHQIKVDWVAVADDDTPATLGPKVLEVWKRHGYFEI